MARLVLKPRLVGLETKSFLMDSPAPSPHCFDLYSVLPYAPYLTYCVTLNSSLSLFHRRIRGEISGLA